MGEDPNALEQLILIPVAFILSGLGVYLIMLFVRGFYRIVNHGRPTVLTPTKGRTPRRPRRRE